MLDRDEHAEDHWKRQVAEEARLRFPPPYIEHSSNSQGFEFVWVQMQYAFGLPDPSSIPPLEEALDERDEASIRRFVEACRELSSYSLLNDDGGFTVSWSEDEGESLETRNPPKEAMRGFAVLFRQVHNDTNASFAGVRTILERASARAADDAKERRTAFARHWRSAHRALLQETLQDIARRKLLLAEGWAPDSEYVLTNRRYSPLELLQLFNYGEYIHWGKKREEHAALMTNPVRHAFTEYQFHMAMIGLAHFYLGYSLMLEHAFPLLFGRQAEGL